MGNHEKKDNIKGSLLKLCLRSACQCIVRRVGVEAVLEHSAIFCATAAPVSERSGLKLARPASKVREAIMINLRIIRTL